MAQKQPLLWIAALQRRKFLNALPHLIYPPLQARRHVGTGLISYRLAL
jgi:hypothetical protein